MKNINEFLIDTETPAIIYSVPKKFIKALRNEAISSFNDDTILQMRHDCFIRILMEEDVIFIDIDDMAHAIAKKELIDEKMEKDICQDPNIKNESDTQDYHFRRDHVLAELDGNAEAWWPMILDYTNNFMNN